MTLFRHIFLFVPLSNGCTGLLQRICGQLHVAGQFGIFCLLLFQHGTFGLQFCLLDKNCLETFNVVGTTGCLHRLCRWFPYPMKKRSALRFFAE